MIISFINYKVNDRFYTKFEGKGTWQSDMIKRYQKYKGIIVIEPSPQPLYKPPLSSFHNNPINFQSSKPNFLFSHRSFFPLFFFRSSIFFILCKCITIPLCIFYKLFLFWFQCLIFFSQFWFRSKFTILIRRKEIEKHRSVSNCLKTVSITLLFSFFVLF